VFEDYIKSKSKPFSLDKYTKLPFYHNLEMSVKKFVSDYENPNTLICTFHYERKENQNEEWKKVFGMWSDQFHKFIFSSAHKKHFGVHGEGEGDKLDQEGQGAWRNYRFSLLNGNSGVIDFIPIFT